MTRVIGWPSYLLRGIPPTLTDRLTNAALEADMSVNDIIRQALCARYRMDCPHESTMNTHRYYGGDVLLLRLQPELYRQIKKETRNRYGAVRTLILATLDDYLEAP